MTALCVSGGGALVKLALAGFTLVWTHTVEKVPWEEDWRVAPDRLVLLESRVKGSGAGMEPPPEARLDGGWYRWTPADPDRTEILLRRSPADGVGDWTLCGGGLCRPLGAIVGPTADPVRLAPCAEDP